MNIYIKVLLGLMALAVLAYAVRKIIASVRKHRRRAEANAAAAVRSKQQLDKDTAVVQSWIDGVTNATNDTQILAHADDRVLMRSIVNWRLLDADFPGYEDARLLYAQALQRKEDRQEITKFRRKRKRATGAEEAALMLEFKHDEGRLFERATGLSDDQTGELVVELALADLERARQGDSAALRRFQSFKLGYQKEVLGSYATHGWLKPFWGRILWPNDWNEMVIEMIEVPSLRDFVGYSRDPQPGTVRQMAAQALDERSLLFGKVVLAYCSVTDDVIGDSGYRSGSSRQRVWPFKQEIGDVLLAEVTKMVYAIHVEQKLFAGPS